MLSVISQVCMSVISQVCISVISQVCMSVISRVCMSECHNKDRVLQGLFDKGIELNFEYCVLSVEC